MFRSNRKQISFPLKKLFTLSINLVFKCQYDFNRNLEIQQKNKAIAKTAVSQMQFILYVFIYLKHYI